jgi:hypothetical protein
MKVREKYRNLSRAELLDKAYELGVNFERSSRSCSQCTVAALHEILGFEDVLVKAATSSCGGQAIQGTGTCGAIIGGTLVLDRYLGRPLEKVSVQEVIPANMEALENAISTASLLCKKYNKEYGSILCPQIQTRLYGRSYCFEDPSDSREFEKAGGHSDPAKCLGVVGNSARWVMEILLDKGVI